MGLCHGKLACIFQFSSVQLLSCVRLFRGPMDCNMPDLPVHRITVILNGLPWKQTEIILSFLRLHPSSAFWILWLTMRATPFLQRDS